MIIGRSAVAGTSTSRRLYTHVDCFRIADHPDGIAPWLPGTGVSLSDNATFLEREGVFYLWCTVRSRNPEGDSPALHNRSPSKTWQS